MQPASEVCSSESPRRAEFGIVFEDGMTQVPPFFTRKRVFLMQSWRPDVRATCFEAIRSSKLLYYGDFGFADVFGVRGKNWDGGTTGISVIVSIPSMSESVSAELLASHATISSSE